jgi:hypothetical protein
MKTGLLGPFLFFFCISVVCVNPKVDIRKRQKNIGAITYYILKQMAVNVLEFRSNALN